MTDYSRFALQIARRRFLTDTSQGFGYAALASLMGLAPAADSLLPNANLALGGELNNATSVGGLSTLPHFVPRAKSVIYLHMVGGPSQIDTYDYKPEMHDWYDKDFPESIRDGQRLTTMTSGQARFPIAPSKYKFAQHGESGMWVSEMLPYTARMVDELCFVRSMHTEAINHEPAITFIQTGNQITGRPCMGSWLSYGLGSFNQDLPTFVVLVAKPSNPKGTQAISARLWSAGYLPGQHAGVSLRSQGDSVLFINNPPGVSSELRRQSLEDINAFNRLNYSRVGDPDIQTRIQQYEMAYRMQASVPELTAIGDESQAVYDLYGEQARTPGTFANTALMARRLVQRGVRFVQIYHNNWDTHSDVGGRLPDQCRDVDQPCWGLIQDLKQQGMLEDTLVVWGGEFGRTIYSQGELTRENYGRDHHPRCFTIWMAGGGSRAGQIYGKTDDFSYNIVENGVHVRDFHATILHLLGIDHERFTFKNQGLDQRLTGVVPAKVIADLLA